jgi:hypothetical protein
MMIKTRDHLGGLQEMLYIFVRMESDQIGTQQAPDNFILPRPVQQTKNLV